jgi:predicted Zn-dependent protease
MKRLAFLVMLAGCSQAKPVERPVAAAPTTRQSVSNATLAKGIAYEREGKLDEALQQYRNAYEAEPEAEHTAAQLARFLARRGDFQAANAIIVAGQKRRPDDAELYALAAAFARLKGDRAGAKENARAALVRKPLDPVGTVELARALLAESKAELAAAMLERSLAANPGDARLHVVMADVAHAMNDDSRALAELQAAAEADPNDPSIHVRIGALAAAHRDLARSEAAYAKAEGMR